MDSDGDNEHITQGQENAAKHIEDNANNDKETTILNNVEGTPAIDKQLGIENTSDGASETVQNTTEEDKSVEILKEQAEAKATEKSKDTDANKDQENEAGNSVNGDQGASNTNSTEGIPVVKKDIGIENTPDGASENVENTTEEDKSAEILKEQAEAKATEKSKDTDANKDQENEAGNSVNGDQGAINTNNTEGIPVVKKDIGIENTPDGASENVENTTEEDKSAEILKEQAEAKATEKSKDTDANKDQENEAGNSVNGDQGAINTNNTEGIPVVKNDIGVENTSDGTLETVENTTEEDKRAEILKQQAKAKSTEESKEKSSRMCKTKTTLGQGTKQWIIGNRENVQYFISTTRTNSYKRIELDYCKNDERIKHGNSVFLNPQCFPEMYPNATGLNGNFFFVNDDITDNFDEKEEMKSKNENSIKSTVLGLQRTYDSLFDSEDIVTIESLLDSKKCKSYMKHHDSMLPSNSETKLEKLHIFKQIIESETDYHNVYHFFILLCVLTILTFAFSLLLISYVFFRRKTQCIYKPGYNLEEREGPNSCISESNLEESAIKPEYTEKKIKMSENNEKFLGNTSSELNNGGDEYTKQDEKSVFENLGDDANSEQRASPNVNEENKAGISVNGNQRAINTNSMEGVLAVDIGIENTSDGTSESVENATEEDQRVESLKQRTEANAIMNNEMFLGNTISELNNGDGEHTKQDAEILMQQAKKNTMEEPKDADTRKDEESEAENSVNVDQGTIKGTKKNEVLSTNAKTKSLEGNINDEMKYSSNEYDKRKILEENNVEQMESNEFENNNGNKNHLNNYLMQKKTILFYTSLLFLLFTSIMLLSFLCIRSDSLQEIREKGGSVANKIFFDKFISWKDLGDLFTGVNSVNLKGNVFDDFDHKELENSQWHEETGQSKMDSHKSALDVNNDAIASFDNKNTALVKIEIDTCSYGMVCDYKRLLKEEDISTIVITSGIDSMYSDFLLFSILMFVFMNYVYSIVIVVKQIYNKFVRENINNLSITSDSVSKNDSQFIQITKEPMSIIMQDTQVDENYEKKEVFIEKVNVDTFSLTNTLTNEMIDEEIPHSHSSTTNLNDFNLKRKEKSNASYKNELPDGETGGKFLKDQSFPLENEKFNSTLLSFQLANENNDFEKKLPSSDAIENEITKEAYDKAFSTFGIDRESNGKEDENSTDLSSFRDLGAEYLRASYTLADRNLLPENLVKPSPFAPFWASGALPKRPMDKPTLDESQCGFNERIKEEKHTPEDGIVFDREHFDRHKGFADSSRSFIQSSQDTEDNENNQYTDEFKTDLEELDKKVEMQDEIPFSDSTLLDIAANTFQKKAESIKCMSYEDRRELEIDPGKEIKFEKKEKVETQRKKLDFAFIASQKKGQSHTCLRNIATTSEKRSPNYSLPNDSIDEISINDAPNIHGISKLQGVSTCTNMTLPGHASETKGKDKNKEENTKSRIRGNIESDISDKKPKSKERTRQEDIIPNTSDTARQPKASEIGDISTSGLQKRKKRVKRSQEMPLVCSSEDAIIERSFTHRQETTANTTRKHRGRDLKPAVDVILLQQGDMRFQFAMKEGTDYKFSFNTEPKLDSFGKVKSVAYNLNLEKKSH
ncbi:hypothetical protein TNCV_3960181 [Trichonephila clavipes]|nr:hypothetical protein TNCV_3960181 [Trichonephila clavipes]